MKIYRHIVTKHGGIVRVAYELNPRELRHAYEEQQHNYDLSDIDNEIDLLSGDLDEEFRIGEFPVTDAEMTEMAYLLRKKLDRDADACYSVCRTEAVYEVLRKRAGEELAEE